MDVVIVQVYVGFTSGMKRMSHFLGAVSVATKVRSISHIARFFCLIQNVGKTEVNKYKLFIPITPHYILGFYVPVNNM